MPLLLILYQEQCEIAYFGILEEYFGKGLGGHLLTEAIKIGFKMLGRIVGQRNTTNSDSTDLCSRDARRTF